MLKCAALIAVAITLLLAGAGAAGAHSNSLDSLLSAPPSAPAAPDRLAVLHAAGADAAVGIPWALILVIVAFGAGLARRRSRKLVAAVLFIVLAVFAVESARHSVHHGFGDQPAACPTALVAAHLSGAPVESIALEAPILELAARLEAPEPSGSPFRSVDPQHGRAPPSPLV